MEGDLVTFKADDTGDKAQLEKMLVPRVLHLKRLCKVMLLWNLSDSLVNGSLGRVVGFGSEGPVVEFPNAGITKEIKPIVVTGMCDIY